MQHSSSLASYLALRESASPLHRQRADAADAQSGRSDLWRRTALEAALVGHQACVNHCSYNSTGSLLVSGSDDTRLAVWAADGDAPLRRPRAVLLTGHADNIFCCRWLEGDGLIASCSGDGTVRVTDV